MSRALYYSEIGGPRSLGGIDAVSATDSEAVVDIAYAGLNSIDGQISKGVGGLKPCSPHHIPGVEGSGWVDGKPVMVFGAGVGVIRSGTAAERITVPKAALFDVPEGLDLAHAAVCGAAGATAMRLSQLAEVSAEDIVVIHAAAGSVGFMLTSLLAGSGVRVVGQVRDQSKSKMVALAGGEAVVASNSEELSAKLADLKIEPAACVDVLGGSWTQASADVLRVGGRILTYGALAGPMTLNTLPFYRKGLTLRGYSGLSDPKSHADCVRLALQAAADKTMMVEPVIHKYPFAKGEEAFDAVLSGMPGKVLLDIAG